MTIYQWQVTSILSGLTIRFVLTTILFWLNIIDSKNRHPFLTGMLMAWDFEMFFLALEWWKQYFTGIVYWYSFSGDEQSS